MQKLKAQKANIEKAKAVALDELTRLVAHAETPPAPDNGAFEQAKARFAQAVSDGKPLDKARLDYNNEIKALDEKLQAIAAAAGRLDTIKQRIHSDVETLDIELSRINKKIAVTALNMISAAAEEAGEEYFAYAVKTAEAITTLRALESAAYEHSLALDWQRPDFVRGRTGTGRIDPGSLNIPTSFKGKSWIGVDHDAGHDIFAKTGNLDHICQIAEKLKISMGL
jgi:hypothetical protein